MTASAQPRRCCVVGGGMLGMTVAHRLAQAGCTVTLLEAAPTLGGLAAAWSLDTPTGSVIWDRHYHVTLLSDAQNRAILRELGLDDDMRWVQTRTGYYANGKVTSASNALEFLRLPRLNLVDKFRIGLTIMYGSRVRNWEPLSRESAATWLRRWSGRRAFERFWEPQLRAKLGNDYDDVAASFIWATVQRLYAARRSGLKHEMFGYVDGGYARVLDVFGSQLESEGVEVRTGCVVTKVERVGEHVRVCTTPDHPGEHEDCSEYDDVVVTVAAPIAARICAGLTNDEYERLRATRYEGIVCMSVLLRRPLSGFYLTYLADPMPFTAVVEMTAFVDPSQTGGLSLVYLPKYVAPDDALFDQSDDEIRASFLPALQRAYPQVKSEDIVTSRVSRVRNVFAVPTVGFADRLPPMQTSVPGVYLASSANIANGTLNVDETVGLAERAARDVLSAAVGTPLDHVA